MNIKEFCEQEGISVRQLAHNIGYQPNYIWSVAAGYLSPGPKLIKVLVNYSKGLITADDLMKNKKRNKIIPKASRSAITCAEVCAEATNKIKSILKKVGKKNG